MTADPNPNDLPVVLEHLQEADPDLLRSMLTAFVQALMSDTSNEVTCTGLGCGA